MSQKFGRNYSLVITGSNMPQITVGLPFTIEFDITRNTLTSANVCQIRLKNLSPSTRGYLLKNVTSGWGTPFIYVSLSAGYGTNLQVIFTGNVSQAWSVREGVDFITQLECYDGGFAFVNGMTSLTVPLGTPYKNVIGSMIGTLPNGGQPNVKVGAVGNYTGTTPKQVTYDGNTITNLNQLTGGGFFIDKGIGNALGNNEVVGALPVFTINASSGLLGTPILEQNIVTFDIVFEPALSIGAAINLQSITAANFNGVYKVMSVKHRGTISQTICGDVITTGTFFALASQTAVPNFG